MKVPAISILLSVNADGYFFQETVRSIREQTFEDFEVTCIDNSSIDSIGDILTYITEQDSRFTRERKDEGSSGGWVFSGARGEYVIFLKNGDVLDSHMLETLYNGVVANQADIAICDFGRIKPNGRETRHEGVRKQWLAEGMTVFSYRDCMDCIMRVADPAPGNKLYRREFLWKAHLKFEVGSHVNDIAFVPVSIAAAQKIVYLPQMLVQYLLCKDIDKEKKLGDIQSAIFEAEKQARCLPYQADIEKAISSFVAETLLLSMTQCIRDFSVPDAEKIYQTAHEHFNKTEFAHFSQESFRSLNRYLEFCTVKKHDYATMKRMVRRRLIVSLTSYPPRIGTVAKVLDSIYAQTRKADEIVLWLAEAQFPGKEADLPQNLVQLMERKRLTVRWCEDLKPHKKYFYALQEYRDDLVVTIDDDLLYPKDMLAALYKSYLLYPDAVSSVRTHLILISEQNQIMPYDTWPKEIDICIHEPCMQLIATGGAGTLYPPNLFGREFFNREAIQQICPLADDLWLKAMQLMSGVPVVLARSFEPLRYLPGTQEDALRQKNVSQKQNDAQLEKIRKWLNTKYASDILVKKMIEPHFDTNIYGMEMVTYYLDKDRRVSRSKRLTAERKLEESECRLEEARNRSDRVENELQQAEIKLEQTESKLKQTQRKQNQTEDKLKQAQDKLKQTQDMLRQSEESKSIKWQLKNVGKFLQQLKAEGHSPVTWWFKYLIYILAWIPEMILAGMVFYLENGFMQTIKCSFKKFLRRR